MKVGITGHQTAPQQAWDYVEEGLRSFLQEAEAPLVGVTSLAAGADQLFAEVILDAGGEFEAVIPCDGYEATFPDGGLRYRSLLTRATRATRLSFKAPSEEAFFAAGKSVVDAVDQMVAVWDGKEAKGLGGTADVVRYAEENGVPVRVIWPAGVDR